MQNISRNKGPSHNCVSPVHEQEMANVKYFRGHLEPLSNMYPCIIKWKGHNFYSSESIYQYEKALRHGEVSLAEKIKITRNSYECKKLTKHIITSNVWKNTNVVLMYKILQTKHKYCEKYRADISQYDEFVEDTFDKFWGKGGSNMLGRLHLKVKNKFTPQK